MNVLVFDTSTDIMYATLGKGDAAPDSRQVSTTENSYNSAFLVSTIGEVLRQNGLTPKDLQAIGVNIGPGSFTGLRASVTVARVMAQQLDIPVVGIPSMQIYSMINATDKQTLCIMDAKRSMAYVGIYGKEGETVHAPSLMEYEKASAMEREGDYFVISDSVKGSGVDFGIHLLTLTKKYLLTRPEGNFNWHELKPLYIQTPPITISKKGRHVHP